MHVNDVRKYGQPASPPRLAYRVELYARGEPLRHPRVREVRAVRHDEHVSIHKMKGLLGKCQRRHVVNDRRVDLGWIGGTTDGVHELVHVGEVPG